MQLDGVTLEQALNQIMTMNQLSYKVLERALDLRLPGHAQKHAQYDEQVVRTFYVSHADATETDADAQHDHPPARHRGAAGDQFNKTANTITVRGTASVVQIIEKIIEQNDKPRAEIVFDVEILEVDRNRPSSTGSNLSEYALGGVFSPEVSPASATHRRLQRHDDGAAPARHDHDGHRWTSTPPSGVQSPPPFNLNTISRGFSTADFYLAVPTAIVQFLESDTQHQAHREAAAARRGGHEADAEARRRSPDHLDQLHADRDRRRGRESAELVSVQDVGVNIDMTPTRHARRRHPARPDPREQLAQAPTSTSPASTSRRSGQRKVTTRLRLRDGESNLLAGLLRRTSGKSLSGFPGAIHVPF